MKLFTQTLNEEEKADKLLTEIAGPMLDEAGQSEEEMEEQEV